MKKYIFLSLLSLAAWACTKTIEFDDKGVGNLIVLNSIIYPDSCISGRISQSTSILKDNRFGSFIDSRVELYENGNKVGQMDPLFGYFRFADIKPQTGKNYRIVVTSGGKQVEAETTIPEKAEIVSVDTVSARNEWGMFVDCKMKIKDATDEDFYRLVFSDESLMMSYNKNDSVKRRYYINKSQYSVNSDDPVFKSLYSNFGGDVIDMGPGNQFAIFPDDYFQGKEYSIQVPTVSFNPNNYYNPANPSLIYYTKQIYYRRAIHIQKLSKGYYNYMKYLQLYNFYRDNPISEPVPVYSNVVGGAGIFGSFNDEARFTLEKIYIPFSMDTIKVEPQQQNGYYYGGGGYSY